MKNQRAFDTSNLMQIYQEELKLLSIARSSYSPPFYLFSNGSRYLLEYTDMVLYSNSSTKQVDCNKLIINSILLMCHF